MPAIHQVFSVPSAEPLSAEAFRQLADAGHTRIPMVREVLSDLDTPLSVYLKLADGPHTYLFESVEGGETWGRYSIIGLPARLTYTFRGHAMETRAHGELVDTRHVDDPLAEVDRLREAHKVPRVPGLPALGRLSPVQTSALVIALVAFVLHGVADNIVRSRTGRALVAIRESEIAAAASGIPLARYKALAFGVSAFYAGIGGGLIGSHTLFVSPDYFGFLESVLFIIMIVVGGLGSVAGSVLGAVVMTAIPEMLGSLQEWYGLIYGAILLVFMIAMPRGIVGVGRGLVAAARLVPGRSAS
jgi:hypothetical protein